MADKRKKKGKQQQPGGSVDYSKPLKNDKYEAFCQQYMKDNNGAQAAIRAGYSIKGANVKASQLLAIINIQGRLAHLQAELADTCGVTAERLMAEWAKIGFVDIKQIIGSGNKIKDISDLPDDVTAAISGVQTTKTGLKVTLCSKETALEHMGKMIGVYEKDNQQKQTNLADFLKAMKK